MTGQVHRPWFRSSWISATAGAVAGFLLGWGIYALATPALQGSDGWIRDTQGLVWNLVPLLTVAGGVLGYLMTRSRT